MQSRGRVNIQRHPVYHQLHRQVSTIRSDTISVEAGAIGTVVAVSVDQIPQGFIKRCGPRGANGMDFVECVGAAVGERVCL